ncbi:prepilin peptidase [Amphritea sp. 2_MG-2023]|uniref:preprotein translocase subunit SecA n=1 Tax=Amphritea TaxID=515417 RepID=UPI001C071EC3|nr:MULTISPECIES: prepilin peptidase [Amphritea]MBU2963962.1 prepilin peptidase [Amphritea atlantica]MDO6419124.1 prepilin peptidase [Amphritea sp. 2_MG-2023]
MSEYASKQPVVAGLRNEYKWQESNWLDTFLKRSKERSKKLGGKLLRRNERMVKAIFKRSAALEHYTADELALALDTSRQKLRLEGINTATIIEAFSVIREVSGRVLGMRHHHTQIRTSLAMLRGGIAEMSTGEGKTLAATLAAATAGLAGIPVHVVTINDYLAERDGEEMLPLYQALGLSVGIIIHERELQERREIYACNICYCSNKELTFDFLKDSLVLAHRKTTRIQQASLLTGDASWSDNLLLRGLHFAIVDEADSVFIDEARTPLIISGQEKFGQREERLLKTAMEIGTKYKKEIDFKQDENSKIHLTAAGHKLLVDCCEPLDGLWNSSFYREPLVKQALAALYVYHLDRDYIIDDEGAVQIVDLYTGRVMPGRSWGQGLQQMIEMKEGCELTKPRETNAEISYQNFFRKYHHLCGMTGTVREVAGELLDVYRLRSETIPLLKKSQRKKGYCEVYLTEQEKWQRVAEVTRELVAKGQAVLIGTNSVASSEAISEVLTNVSIEHKILNARQDKEEADIVSVAGYPGAVMVATSMAGRGTDIKLTDETRASGGLHVVITELQDAARIDRQLAGRSARQGDPGAVSEILSFEDQLVKKMAGPLLRKLIQAINTTGIMLPHRLGYRIQLSCQKKLSRSHYKQRMQLIKVDTQRQRTLAFTGDKK